MPRDHGVCHNLADGDGCVEWEPPVAEVSMTRRKLLRAGAGLVAGQAAVKHLAASPPQGREFRPYTPPRPPKGRIIDMHVHPWFQDEKLSEPKFSKRAWNSSRPDGGYDG